ncbi:hypothetical protein SAMN05216566_12635 [Aureimonas phyllosphaerae]|nr:hypothetical protein SAMN05216566_12635 [Aureimonas phyllosphaerae]
MNDRQNQMLEGIRGIHELGRYSLPKVPDLAGIMPKIPDLKHLYPNPFPGSQLREAMERMTTPWADQHRLLESVTGFARLQGIGHAINGLQPFHRDLTSALRRDLGDWRDPITWPSVLAVPERRLELYVERGFDPALTDFSPEAFTESAVIAGLGHVEVRRARDMEVVAEDADDADDEDQLRTETAFQHLHRMEVKLRRFIENVMAAAHGPDWPRHRLAPQTLEAWEFKKQKAEDEGGPVYPLIFYADFMDYQAIICRSDDWKNIFAPIFKRKESVRETFQRLHPVRLATMHARFVTPDDALFLMAETLRIMRAISR